MVTRAGQEERRGPHMVTWNTNTTTEVSGDEIILYIFFSRFFKNKYLI
jgi:hypothetical protein